MPQEIVLSSPADFHVHVRQGKMCELVTPQVAKGGVRTAYVMPNLVPPLTSTDAVVSYKADLEKIDPSVQWLMTLYLHPDVTPAEIRKAAKAGIKGVKSYPRGVTTNSSSGIEDYEVYYPVFKAMEEEGMVLNLHGEVPSDADKNISILNAEVHFLEHLRKLATAFPKLRIVLEHATTSAAVEAVASLPSNVACTITAHHLYLTIDEVAPQPHHFCKPLAKEPKDRKALQDAIKSGNEKFFLGSDSAPHPLSSKAPALTDEGAVSACAAGVYTSPILIPLVATLLESFGALDKLEGFVSGHGRKFYGEPAKKGQELTLRRTKENEGFVKGTFRGDGVEVMPFWTGKRLGWEIAQ
ncbi:dihydroorotase, homodimeric type [Cryptococcus deuterogattii 99/473]|uniref:dihydroorotase n=3 Tax=Cryptococcus gattii species complex TaxID=1884637 RepID=A0A0D0VCB3_9TREE|nr:dihydroorotase, homodimeric type [Cryptococcus deuterogattii LA55]KIR35759.1 dihydroorotase, homodimeric type [Cryptococcus deuterogattii MMRL2647]KIR42490.1 dihydroorotase, homodimeric type [Cryptococcus deuterogattii Ram5]KIR48249.1 dihydroorotase, homodimeric type [Cryptococcus bacillisporus CA1280]KIR69026.1 dihydroorotase, homodimeric type [Cryptococcus bacillisporus CA1873]KIR95134.1 dihydroorotase, homodimeric type [Cryptococcus deuterogattii CBS 10090]KIS00344.1 dihydroorotase, hom|eukprot:KIR69026.1 dihydroorotase, homodimeric type [Cryptococcus gattii CA1873]